MGKSNGNGMSKEDLDQVRAERAEKDRMTATKATGKRGRKRKVPAREAEGDTEDKIEGGAHALDVDLSMSASKDKGTKETGVEEPEPWRAPVALMYKRAA